MITLEGFIDIPEEYLDKAKCFLESQLQETLNESGCISFKITQDKDIATRFYVHESFKDKVAFDQHQKRSQNITWGAFSKNFKRSYQITEDN